MVALQNPSFQSIEAPVPPKLVKTVAVTLVVDALAVILAIPMVPEWSIPTSLPISVVKNPCPLLIPVTAEAVIVTEPDVAEGVSVVEVALSERNGPSDYVISLRVQEL